MYPKVKLVESNVVIYFKFFYLRDKTVFLISHFELFLAASLKCRASCRANAQEES